MWTERRKIVTGEMPYEVRLKTGDPMVEQRWWGRTEEDYRRAIQHDTLQSVSNHPAITGLGGRAYRTLCQALDEIEAEP